MNYASDIYIYPIFKKLVQCQIVSGRGVPERFSLDDASLEWSVPVWSIPYWEGGGLTLFCDRLDWRSWCGPCVEWIKVTVPRDCLYSKCARIGKHWAGTHRKSTEKYKGQNIRGHLGRGHIVMASKRAVHCLCMTVLAMLFNLCREIYGKLKTILDPTIILIKQYTVFSVKSIYCT